MYTDKEVDVQLALAIGFTSVVSTLMDSNFTTAAIAACLIPFCYLLIRSLRFIFEWVFGILVSKSK